MRKDPQPGRDCSGTSVHQTSRIKLFFLFLFCSVALWSAAQKQGGLAVVHGQLVKSVPSLRNITVDPSYKPVITRDLTGLVVKKTAKREKTMYGSKATTDPAVQQSAPALAVGNAIGQNYDGMPFTNVAPADPTMATGGNYVLQMINGSSGAYLKIWDKAGAVVVNQVYMDLLFATPGYNGAGDPVVLYDQFADRYFITEFGYSGGVTAYINTLIVGVSQTNNPAGAWNVYRYQDNSFFVDYPHWGVWPNALYATSNDFNTAGTAYLGSSVYAFNKAAMIAGSPTAQMQRQRFNNADEVYISVAPVSISGTTAPAAGSPGLFVYFSDDNLTANPADVDFLQTITFQPDFATPSNTVIALGDVINTAAFQSNWCNYNRNCVPSAGGGYDALADRIMNRIYYRNFGTHEALVLTHTVNANAGIGMAKAGLRWYELRRTGGHWGMYQQSTYAPDADHRWMGTIGINAAGQIALGYNHSGAGKFASIYFVGRNAADPLNAMTTAETLVFQGTGYGTFSNRWGDYNDIATDATDDATFWMTAMYGTPAPGNWRTRIASFTVGDACPAISASPATLPNYNYNVPYSTTVTPTGSAASPFTFSIQSGALPTGLVLNSSTGEISGTPTGIQNSTSFVIGIKDANGCVGTKAYTLASNNVFDITQACNSSPITIPSSGAATPYPSTITVSGVSGLVNKLTVTLNNFNHTWTNDVDILLVAPGGQRAIILSDVGANSTGVSNVTLTLDDDAAQSLPNNAAIVSGTFKPTNYGLSDPFPAPAGATTANVALSTFAGINPNGVWSLYIVDDVGQDQGNVNGGWCLNFIAATAAPQITCPANVVVNTDPGACTASVALTGANAATATGNPSPTVAYSIAGTPISSPYNFPAGATTVTATASSGVAPDATCTFTVTVNDAQPPTVTTCPPAQSFVANMSGTYTVPPIAVSDNCPGVSVSYAITGATTRSGMGNDASGAFAEGMSTIAWTVTDAAGNTNTSCNTAVTVTPACVLTVAIPNVSVLPSGVAPNTVYLGYAPAASITLTAQPSGGAPPYSYLWSNGATTQSITVSPTANTVYSVTVSAAGCTPATASKTVTVVDVRCGNKLDKVSVCHVPPGNPSNARTICVSANAVPDHLASGSYLGACGVGTVTTKVRGPLTDEATAAAFRVQASPNPTNRDFTLVLSSENSRAVQLNVVNAVGKLVESRSGIPANGSFKIGLNYRPGVYYATLVQGGQRITVKLIKGSN